MSHRDSVTAAPEGARVTAGSPPRRSPASRTPSAASTASSSIRRWCTPSTARRSSRTSSTGVADAPPAWTAAAVIEEETARIRAQVGRERVLCALSGGVDSAVAALLVHKAVGDQLTCVFVDHGLLRKDEAAQVVETFGAPLPRAARARGRARALPLAARRASPIPRRSARRSARSSSGSSRRRRARSATSASSSRGRSTRT